MIYGGKQMAKQGRELPVLLQPRWPSPAPAANQPQPVRHRLNTEVHAAGDSLHSEKAPTQEQFQKDSITQHTTQPLQEQALCLNQHTPGWAFVVALHLWPRGWLGWDCREQVRGKQGLLQQSGLSGHCKKLKLNSNVLLTTQREPAVSSEDFSWGMIPQLHDCFA